MDKIDKLWLTNEMDRFRKINELVKGYNEIMRRVKRLDGDVTERLDNFIHRFAERLDNHISKHKEYAEGGDPCPNGRSDI